MIGFHSIQMACRDEIVPGIVVLLSAVGQIADQLTLRLPETEFARGIKRLGYLLTEVMFLLVSVGGKVF